MLFPFIAMQANGELGPEVRMNAYVPVDDYNTLQWEVQVRTDGQRDFVFVMNFTPEAQPVPLDGATYTDVLTGSGASGSLTLAPYGLAVLARPAQV